MGRSVGKQKKMTVWCHTGEWFRNRLGMTHSLHTPPLLKNHTPDAPLPRPSLLRRFRLAALALVAALLGSMSAHAAAVPEKEQFIQIITAHASECTWKLEDKSILGSELAAKGLAVTVTDVKWDDDHVYFHLSIGAPADMQNIVATRKNWVYVGVWSYSRGGTLEAPVLKLTEEPATIAPRGSRTPSPTPLIPRNIRIPRVPF
jgi:hypothetical protein